MPRRSTKTGESVAPVPKGTGLDTNGLEGWLWDAACSIRGAVDAPKFKDYILPLVFLKRLSDVFDDDIARLTEKFGDRGMAMELAEEDHSLVRSFIPSTASWPKVRKLTGNLGHKLTDIMRDVAKANPSLQGVIDTVDFNATVSGQRIVEDGRLSALIEILSRHRLGLDDVEPDIFGRAYEYLLRKFAEGQGQAAGEFYTPKEVGWLIARLLQPKEGMSVYDPACGSAGLLIKAQLLVRGGAKNVKRPLQLYGQELNHSTYAIAKMNMVIHDMEGDVAIGDTLRAPKHLVNGKLQKFDLVVANPMWNQDGYDSEFYDGDGFGRFHFGEPPASSADWAWVQHMVASLTSTGRAGIVLDTNAVNRGSGAPGNNRERDIRKAVIEADLIEAVVLLPENLFYNTGAPGIVVFLNKSKPSVRRDRILLINLSQHFEKGSPKNFLPDSAIDGAAEVFANGNEEPGVSRWITKAEAKAIDYDISPARHVPPLPRERTIAVDIALESLATLEEERKRLARARTRAFAKVRGVDPRRLKQETPLGRAPSAWRFTPLADAFSDSKSGDWGRDVLDNGDDYILCKVIKGTNFRDVSALDLACVPERLIKRTTYNNRRPHIGDLLIEISGGGKYQATGRVLYVSEELLGLESTPLFFSNFLKLLRPDQTKFEPLFVYHYWKMLYALHRTEIYEKQPTNIKNFKYKDFLASEQIPVLDRDTQSSLAEVLDLTERELLASNRAHAALDDLFRVAGYDLLVGRFGIDSDDA
jgi:type I restriction enzyme M protein